MNDPPALRLPVYRPNFPNPDRMFAYLKRSYQAERFTNRGPLVEELERRLSAVMGKGEQVVTVTGSGTAALEASILATAGRATEVRPYAFVPSYTFVATALAAERCGYTPFVLDIDPATWSMSPETVINHPMFDRAGVVVPVAPYGRRFSQEPWARLAVDSGVPVVIDAAASFDTLASSPDVAAGPLPVVLSFQATKAFSSGEGGAVVWNEIDGLMRVAQAVNFGFLGQRESASSGTNGRMSELHAAAGLAMLDEWPDKRSVPQPNRRGVQAKGRSPRSPRSPGYLSGAGRQLLPVRDGV